ncbi:MAG: hypothetical protein NTX52_05335, partial [Planctomycetota bacterium]|nr:hypothetical protein [Planctomycetota bacterium]
RLLRTGRIVLEERTSQGSTAYRWFVYGNYIDEALLFEWQIGEQNTRFYFGNDHLYSPVVLFTNSGIVLERYEYDAYGKVRIMNANYVNLSYSLLGNTYYFTGRELDTLDAGNCTLYYYRARYYAPTTGRFLQRDPLEYVDGMSLYEFARSNSLRWKDPLGLYCGECTPPSHGRNAYESKIIDWRTTQGMEPGIIDTNKDRIKWFSALGSAADILMDIGKTKDWSEVVLQLIKNGVITLPSDLLTDAALDALDAIQDGLYNMRGIKFLWAQVEYKTCVSCVSANPYLWGGCREYKWKKERKWHFCRSKNADLSGAIAEDKSTSKDYSYEESVQDAMSDCQKSASEHPDEPSKPDF